MKSVDSEQNRDVEKCMNKEIENIFLFCLFQGWESSQHITNDRIPWIKSETNKQKRLYLIIIQKVTEID